MCTLCTISIIIIIIIIDTGRLTQVIEYVEFIHLHHRHHLFAQYAKMNSKICNVPDRKYNTDTFRLVDENTATTGVREREQTELM